MTFVTRRALGTSPRSIAFRDPIATQHFRQLRGGLGAINIGTGASTGAAIGTVVPVLGTAIGGAIGTLAALASSLIGGPSADAMKNIWNVVPLSLLRVSGGHGTWTDTLTGQTMPDAGTDLRKSAIVASAINAFNDPQNHWYDATTQQYINGATALQRWQQRFGSLDFANAYSSAPQAFRVFGPDPSQDPAIRLPAAVPTTPAGAPVPLTSASATPQQIAAARTAAGVVPAQASLLGGLSTPLVLLIGAGLLYAVLKPARAEAPAA